MIRSAGYAAPKTAPVTWSDVANKPSTFAPAAHGHAWGEITDKPLTFPTATPVIPVALIQFTVANNIVTTTSLFGITSVTRISAGRYRCTFSTPQPDLLYNPRTDLGDANFKFSRINNGRTTTYFEIMVAQVTVTSGAATLAAADANEVFASADRKG